MSEHTEEAFRDITARRDIAVLQVQMAVIEKSLDGISGTLNKIFLALITGMGGAAGAAIWSVVFGHK